MTALIQHLAEICREHPLREKWLVAPSRRVAHQWLDRVTVLGAPVVNARVQTTGSLALDIVKPALVAEGLAVLSPAVRRLVVAAAWTRTMDEDGYLGRARMTPRLVTLTEQTLTDLRMGGLTCGDLDPGHFERADKGRELRMLLADYEGELKRRGLIDHAEAMRRAAARLRSGSEETTAEILLLVPDDMRWTTLEQALLDAFGARRIMLASDEPADADTPPRAGSDLEALRWIELPPQAPPPVQDGSVRIAHAVGEINEVRGALRRCLAAQRPIDEVEILYATAEPYVPLIYDTAQRLFEIDNALDLGVPLTFAEGIPARLSRPGRLLTAWLVWIREGFPQATLMRMMRAGLLRLPVDEDGDPVGTARLVRALGSLGIGLGRERHLQCIDARVAGLERLAGEGEDAERLKRRLATARALAGLVKGVIGASPPRDAGAAEAVRAAVQLLRDQARQSSRLDGLARHHLLQEIEPMADALAAEPALPAGFSAWDWLAELPDRLRVGGSGPRPGHLHVASWRTGGHSGRPETIVLGLDDTRLPSAGYQDPLALDAERDRLGGGLMTASQRLREQREDFARLVSRLRGRVTLSFSSRDLAEDSEMFASPVVLSAFRILSGQRDGDHAALLKWLEPAASFAPRSEDRCLDTGEWWLCHAAREKPVGNLATVAAATFEHVARGWEAVVARASNAFTEFDGHLPDPGPELDPLSARGPVVSATGMLQQLGGCPLACFYQRVLRIHPPDDVAIDPEMWLSPLDFGTLFHDVLYEFVAELLDSNAWPPDPQRDLPRMATIVERNAAAWRKKIAPPNTEAERRQREKLDRAAEIFVNEQARRGDRGRPVYLEATIGMPSEERPTDLNAPDPVSVALPGGGALRARARIDRIDRRRVGNPADDPIFSIVDYKSGSWTKGYDPPDAFGQGRLVQHVLYMAVVEAVLKAHLGAAARVDEFRFVFPGVRTHGREIEFGRAILPEGLAVVERLCTLAGSGAFPATDDVEDCRFCDYRQACQAVNRDLKTICASTRRKMTPENRDLKPFVELRRGGP